MLDQTIFNQEKKDWNLNAKFYEKDMFSPFQNFFDQKIWANYQIKPRNPVLEVGCGPGSFSKYFDKPTVTDISPKMLKVAQKNFSCKPVRCSANKLSFKDKTFKTVVINNTLHHLKGQRILKESLKEALRVAKADAVFCITDRAPTLAGNGSVQFLMLLKHLTRHFLGKTSGCGSYHELPFDKKDYALLRNYLDFKKEVYWRTLPTYVLTVATHHISLIFGWRIGHSTQRVLLPLIIILEKYCNWSFWCTELSIVAQKKQYLQKKTHPIRLK